MVIARILEFKKKEYQYFYLLKERDVQDNIYAIYTLEYYVHVFVIGLVFCGLIASRQKRQQSDEIACFSRRVTSRCIMYKNTVLQIPIRFYL